MKGSDSVPFSASIRHILVLTASGWGLAVGSFSTWIHAHGSTWLR